MSEKKKPEVKPTRKRKRTSSMANVSCGVGNCEYSSKYNAYVTKHRQQAHQTHVVRDKSVLDRSVSFSEVFDATASTGSQGDKTNQESYDAIAKAPSSTLKKLSLDTDSQVAMALFPRVNQSQSPEKAVCDKIMRQAEEATWRKDKGTETEEELEKSVSLMAAVNSSAPKDSVSDHDVTSLEDETVASTSFVELNQESDSLSLTFSGGRDNQEVNGLQDALSKVNEMTVKAATDQRKLETCVDVKVDDRNEERDKEEGQIFARPPPPIIPSNFQFGAQQIPIGAFSSNSQAQNLQPAHHTCGRGPQAGGAVQNWQPQLPSSEELMRARQEAAIQHQTLSRRLQLDQLREELSNVQSQIHASHNQPPGMYNLQELMFQEANLMQRLTEAGKFNPGL